MPNSGIRSTKKTSNRNSLTNKTTIRKNLEGLGFDV